MLQPARDDSLDIAILCGGASSERDISLQSGHAVATALSQGGHNVASFDPTEVELSAVNWHAFDVCFIALHGGAGEDGRVQMALDEMGVPYTGSGPQASRLAMSKLASKARWRVNEVPTPEAVSLRAGEPIADVVRKIGPIGFPLVIKPDGQGCSLGVGTADRIEQLAECVAVAGRYETHIMAERHIKGREFTVALLGRQPLPVLEIEHQNTLFDFDAKFRSHGTRVHGLAADDPAGVVATHIAIEATTALGTRGLVRVDLIIDADGCPWVLELNTVPGMTERSLAPRAAALAGMEMPAFCERIVRESLAPVEVVA